MEAPFAEDEYNEGMCTPSAGGAGDGLHCLKFGVQQSMNCESLTPTQRISLHPWYRWWMGRMFRHRTFLLPTASIAF